MDPFDKKSKKISSSEIKGFEDFVREMDIKIPTLNDKKNQKESNYEGLTLLKNDETRLTKMKNLLTVKLPLADRYDQSSAILNEQTQQLEELKKELFLMSEKGESGFKKSLGEIIDEYFSHI
jgi:hypothetical protein